MNRVAFINDVLPVRPCGFAIGDRVKYSKKALEILGPNRASYIKPHKRRGVVFGIEPRRPNLADHLYVKWDERQSGDDVKAEWLDHE